MACVFNVEANHNIITDDDLKRFFNVRDLPVPEWDLESIQESLKQADRCFVVWYDWEFDTFVIYELESV